jgi:putative DNA primase/helicase
MPGILEPCDDACQMNGTEAFNAYLDWCEAENLPQRERWTRRTFYDAMEERGITRRKTKTGIALVGVREAGAHAPATGPGIFAKE